jgi:hypothetical protein
MCTMIAVSAAVSGAGKGSSGWFPITQATVGFDHATHSGTEHALLLDFTNYGLGVDARVALELDLGSGRVLMAQLQSAIEAAQAIEAARAVEAAGAGEAAGDR